MATQFPLDNAPGNSIAPAAGSRIEPPLGRRILVWGNSCSGKSTLAAALADAQGSTFVDLDALNWLPGWVGLNATDPERLQRRMETATRGDAWVVAGSYTKQSMAAFWPKLQTIIWLDLPMHTLLRRVLVRSWRRWRSDELLWGTNRERFWPQLMIWRGEESLIWWIVTAHHRKQRQSLSYMTDPAWSHVQWLRLTREADVNAFARAQGVASELPAYANGGHQR